MIYGWRPISELHEDMGTVVAININGKPNMKLVHVYDNDFYPEFWTHFTQITPLIQRTLYECVPRHEQGQHNEDSQQTCLDRVSAALQR